MATISVEQVIVLAIPAPYPLTLNTIPSSCICLYLQFCLLFLLSVMSLAFLAAMLLLRKSRCHVVFTISFSYGFHGRHTGVPDGARQTCIWSSICAAHAHSGPPRLPHIQGIVPSLFTCSSVNVSPPDHIVSFALADPASSAAVLAYGQTIPITILLIQFMVLAPPDVIELCPGCTYRWIVLPSGGSSYALRKMY